MNYPLISVIVPVYKVEKYVAQCIESIQAQTYPNWELICVDDGSPDASGAICDRFADEDSRIRVVHQKNQGLSQARNAGTGVMQGQYAAFIDSDDYVAPNYLMHLYEIMAENHCDAASVGALWTPSREEDFSRQPPLNVRVFSPQEAVLGLLGEDYLQLVTGWGKLIPAGWAKEFSFPAGKKREDEGTTYKFLYSGTWAVSNQALYGYYQNPQSIMHTVDEKNLRDLEEVTRLRYQYFEEKGDTVLADHMRALYLNTLISWAAQGMELGRGKLKNFTLGQMLSMQVRPLYKLNFLCWKLFRFDLIGWLDTHRKG